MPTAASIKTLIVDDQQTMRSLIRTSLQALGINQTREAPDGEGDDGPGRDFPLEAERQAWTALYAGHIEAEEGRAYPQARASIDAQPGAARDMGGMARMMSASFCQRWPRRAARAYHSQCSWPSWRRSARSK